MDAVLAEAAIKQFCQTGTTPISNKSTKKKIKICAKLLKSICKLVQFL